MTTRFTFPPVGFCQPPPLFRVAVVVGAALVGLGVTSCSGGSGDADHDVAVESDIATEAETAPTGVGLDLSTGDDPETSEPLALALSAPTLAPTATPTPRPTVPTAEPTLEAGSDSNTARDAESPATNSGTAPTGTEPSAPSGGATNGTEAANDPSAPTPTVAPVEAIAEVEFDADDVVVHGDGVATFRWGDEGDAVGAYVSERLGQTPSVVEQAQSTTGLRQLVWPGFMIDTDADGALAGWYWYPSFADGVVVRELGSYKDGLHFDRQPSGTQIQTIGSEPNRWWIGTDIALRYAWDPLDDPPQRASDVVGAVIYVTGGPNAAILEGEPTTLPAGTEILMAPNGTALYSVSASTPAVMYRHETRADQNWALVVPGFDDALAGYVLWPPSDRSTTSTDDQ